MSERDKPHPLKEFGDRYANINEKRRGNIFLPDFDFKNQLMILGEKNGPLILVQPLRRVTLIDSSGREVVQLKAKVGWSDEEQYYSPNLVRQRLLKRLLTEEDRIFLSRFWIKKDGGLSGSC